MPFLIEDNQKPLLRLSSPLLGVDDLHRWSSYYQIPRLTTVQRDTITGVNGMSIYNQTEGYVEDYENGSWLRRNSISFSLSVPLLTGLEQDGDVHVVLL